MRRLATLVVLASGCSSETQPARNDGSVDDASSGRDAMIDAAIDARPDAAPPTPRQLALAALGGRGSLRVYTSTTSSFRKVLDMADPLGFGTSVAWTDYDQDERDDLVSIFAVPDMPGNNEMLIVHNDGDSGLSVAGGRMMNPALLVGYDAEADGDGDVYVGMQGGGDLLFRSDGTALPMYYSWTEPGNSAWEYGIATGDMTGDGRPEVVLARGLYGEAISRGTMGAPSPAWSKEMSAGSESTDAAMVDFDGDGLLDATFAKQNTSGTGGSVEAYRWNGTTFVSLWSTTSLGGALSIDWADVDGDGDADVALCVDGGVLNIYLRDGMDFTPHAINDSSVPCYVAIWGDYDADGDPDLATNGEGTNSGVTVFNNAGGTLTSVFHDNVLANAIAWGRCAPGATACFADAPTL